MGDSGGIFRKGSGSLSGRTGVQGPASDDALYQRPHTRTKVSLVGRCTRTRLSVLSAYSRDPSFPAAAQFGFPSKTGRSVGAVATMIRGCTSGGFSSFFSPAGLPGSASGAGGGGGGFFW